MSHRWVLPGLLALLACFSGGWFLQRRLAVSEDVYQQARLFEEVLAHVRDYHVDSLPESELYQRATEGMLSQLHDPYAALLTARTTSGCRSVPPATTPGSGCRSTRGTAGSR